MMILSSVFDCFKDCNSLIPLFQVKAALARATVLVENAEKHGRIQCLVVLICTMMEACPAQLNQPPNVCFKQQQHGYDLMLITLFTVLLYRFGRPNL